jgi:pimeloyl-ACP methyl ester carboxylesterase
MARINVNGIDIGYEIVGTGRRTAVITAGGRFAKETPGIRELAVALSDAGMKVLIWDRPNCGESDVCFEAETESILNADTLAALLTKLNMAPALVIGGSAGSRVSLITAQRHPEVVDKLALVWISGGWAGLASLAMVYCGNALTAARMGGMEAVAKDGWWPESIARNPANRERILSQDVDRFCDTMQRWAKSFFPEEGSPVPGLLPRDFAAMKMPVLIFRSGHSDPHHPRLTSEEVHRLIPGSQLLEPPWGDREWIERMQDAKNGLFRRYPLLVPQILKFAESSTAARR